MAGRASNGTLRNFTEDDLQRLNDDKAETLIPAMLVLGILMVLGLVGNSLVCYVFGFRLKSGTQNFLIICLAVFDLLTCTIAVPTEIADMRYYYMFRSEAACKIMRFITTFSAIGSIFILLVIAVDRFRKICRPFESQMRVKHVKMSLIPVIGGALFFSWPAWVLYGLRTTFTKIPGLDGQTCSTPDALKDSYYHLIYNGILLIAFAVMMVTLIVLYFFILRETKRHYRYMKRNSDFSLPSTDSTHYHSDSDEGSVDNHPVVYNAGYSPTEDMPNSERGDGDHHATEPVAIIAFNTTLPVDLSELEQTSRQDGSNNGGSSHPNGAAEKHHFSTSSSFDSDTTEISYVDSFRSSNAGDNSQSQNGVSPKKPSILHVSSDEHRNSHAHHVSISGSKPSFLKKSRLKLMRTFFRSKTTVIAFWVTMVFILSFLPHLSLQVAKINHKDFDYKLEGSALVAYNIFLRSHIFNSVSNPIIYGVFNSQFRGEVKKLGSKLHGKVRFNS